MPVKAKPWWRDPERVAERNRKSAETRLKNRGPIRSPEYLKLQNAAIQAVGAAVLSGKLPSLSKNNIPCVDCGAKAIHYDNHDYTKKLDVQPVCRCCNYKRGKTVNAEHHRRKA